MRRSTEVPRVVGAIADPQRIAACNGATRTRVTRNGLSLDDLSGRQRIDIVDGH